MEFTQKAIKNKYIKNLICFTLCITLVLLTFVLNYEEAHALAPALVLAGVAIPEAVQIVGALLIAAGVTWAADTAIDATCKWFYANAAPAVRESISNVITSASNGVASITEDVWNYAKSFVQTNFSVGEQVITKHYYDATLRTTIGSDVITQYMPANYSVPITEMPVGLPMEFTIGVDTYTVVLNDYIGANKTLTLLKNGTDPYTHPTINTAVPWALYLEAYDSSGVTKFRIRLRKAGYNKTTWDSTDSTIVGSISDTVGLEAIPGTWDIPVTGQDIISNPDWDIADENGARTVYYPSAVADLVGDTYVDVTTPSTNEPIDPPAAVEPSWLQSLLENLIGGITGILNNKWQWLQDFWDKLLEKLQQALQPVTDVLGNILAKAEEIVNSIAGVQTVVQEADFTETARTYRLPDLFILILKVILACIRLILRAIVFIATIQAIPADAGDINPDFLSGVNFLKNQTIPFFNITFWNMATGIIGILFALAVVRRIRRLYSI